MQFSVLGPLQVRRDGQVVAIGSSRQRSALALLVDRHGETVPLDALAEAMWESQVPGDPRNAVQTAISRLRSALGDPGIIATTDSGYRLAARAEDIDVVRFERLLAEAAGESPAKALGLTEQALALWRGEPYAGVDAIFARASAARLSELHVSAQEHHAELLGELGRHEEALAALRYLVLTEPLRERPVALLMETAAALGRTTEAVRAFQDFRSRLVDETGLEPGDDLVRLESRILAGAGPPTARSGPARPEPRLPRATTTLVGREDEISAAEAALDHGALVTLTGPGGIGKTRVALEVARRAAAGTDVGWVELGSVASADALAYAVADAVGADLAGSADRSRRLVSALSAREMLLVLDNCEHLVDAVASLVHEIGIGCPGVGVLATSRERLRVEGEHVRVLAPLRFIPVRPGEQPEAVVLFTERATAGGAKLGPADSGLVTEICHRLEGLPLAIELAAARAGSLALADLLELLDQGQPEMLSRRGGEVRHRDLWSVTAWSYELLSPPEQLLFERLSVFSGRFTAEAAHEVCAESDTAAALSVARLGNLVERSLLEGPGQSEGEGTGRYRMLRPLRAFARQRLADRGERSALARRHAETMVALARRWGGPPLDAESWSWLEESFDDMREAQRRAVVEGDPELLARLVSALFWFGYWRTGSEVSGWAERCLEMAPPDEMPDAPVVLASAAVAAWMRGELGRAQRLAVRATESADDAAPAVAMAAAEALADVALFEGRLADARASFEEVTRLARLAGDPDGEVLGTASVAMCHAYDGSPEAALGELGSLEPAYSRCGPPAQAFALYVRGECQAESDPAEALELVEAAAESAAAHGITFAEGVARVTAVSLRSRLGDPEAALAGYGDLVQHWRRTGNWTQQWTTLLNLAETLVRLGRDEPAVLIAAAAEADSSGGPSFGAESERLVAAMATARNRMGPERFERAGRRGAALSHSEVLDVAVAETAVASG